MTDKLISADPQNKSFDENIEQIDIDLIEWRNYNDNICPQCGQDHSYKPTTSSAILDIISLFDRDKSKEI